MVSVIIPNYNHAPFLRERIDSVLNQSYLDFEVILLDDCSTDRDSCKIIEEYRDHPKVSHIVLNQKNSGTTFKQWRKGIELALGEYIWIAESDDVADPFFLEKLMSLVIPNQAVLAFSRSQLIDLNGKLLREKNAIIDDTDEMAGDEFICKHLLYQNSVYNASMVVFRKDAIDASIWDRIAQFRYCGDWLFWYQLASKGMVVESKDILNSFRVHGLNVSSRAETSGLSLLEGFRISREISQKLKITKTIFAKHWNEIWTVYRQQYQFSKKVNMQILKMFLLQYPLVVVYFIKQKISL